MPPSAAAAAPAAVVAPAPVERAPGAGFRVWLARLEAAPIAGEGVASRIIRAAFRKVTTADVPLALAASGALGRLVQACGLHGPTNAEIADLLGPGPRPRRVAGIAREMAALAFQNRALYGIQRSVGLDVLVPHVRSRDAGRLLEMHRRRQPAVLVSWHAGPVRALHVLLHGLGIPVLALTGEAPRLPAAAGGESIQAGGEPWRAAHALRRAIRWLESGGFVAVMIDGLSGAQAVDVEFLGRRVRLARGAATLARLGGAPLVPFTNRFAPSGRSLEVELHAPVAAPPPPAGGDAAAADGACVAAAVALFERILAPHPERLWLESVARLRDAPRRVAGARTGP